MNTFSLRPLLLTLAIGFSGSIAASYADLLAAALVGAIPVAQILGIPFGQVFVAFAPGGVEAMAAMALALGYDPAYVATHHLFRIILLFFLLPVGVKILKKIR